MDEAQEWASRLHVDGAPGALEAQYRQLMGDAAYEAANARGEAIADASMQEAQGKAHRAEEAALLLGAVRALIATTCLLAIAWSIYLMVRLA